MVALRAFDVGHSELRICKQTALPECVARLRARFQVLLGSRLRENEVFSLGRSRSVGFLAVSEWGELLVIVTVWIISFSDGQILNHTHFCPLHAVLVSLYHVASY